MRWIRQGLSGEEDSTSFDGSPRLLRFRLEQMELDVQRTRSLSRLLCTVHDARKCCQSISHINFYKKLLGQRSMGKPYSTLDEAGVGNVGKVEVSPA